MTQWEQIKNEYREIPIPAEGPQQILQAMAEAKRKRSRLKNLTKYGSVAAAAVLVVLLIPGIRLFSGGFGVSTEDSAYLESETTAESTGSDGGWFAAQSAKDNMAPATSEASNGSNKIVTTVPEYGLEDNDLKAGDSVAVTEQNTDKAVFWAGCEEDISKEILRQMEERMQKNGETYYIKSEENPQGFELLDEDQEYYLNEEGLLVIVFESGSVAPMEQDAVEFIIPAEVFSP